jgi:hypothetical protein
MIRLAPKLQHLCAPLQSRASIVVQTDIMAALEGSLASDRLGCIYGSQLVIGNEVTHNCDGRVPIESFWAKRLPGTHSTQDTVE